MWRTLKEKLSILVTKHPGRVVLLAIAVFNVIFILISALLISNMHLPGTEQMGFLQAAFSTIMMILDAGCISFVIENIGQANVGIAVLCLIIIFVGLISFTGAVIGYITNVISGFIDNADSDKYILEIRSHVAILNWNTRASEIINDLLYSDKKEKVVVLVGSGKEAIQKEIEDRLIDTIAREKYINHNTNLLKPTVIVREGDVYSTKQLMDINLQHAKMVIILGNDQRNTVCNYGFRERMDMMNSGNAQTIKTLMQVADITASETSDDNQKIVVEITDEWTSKLVDKIIKAKQVDQKCNIVPVHVNVSLGQILAQFCLMPELNMVYQELFSNKGATFYSRKAERKDDAEFIRDYLAQNDTAIPLTFMDYKGDTYAYFVAGHENAISSRDTVAASEYRVKLNKDYWIDRKKVIIMGHNSKSRDIMNGFQAFVGEWQKKDDPEDILELIVIDDKDSLDRMNNYVEYPFVQTYQASVYEMNKIIDVIKASIASHTEDTSILILSDDRALAEDTDANVLSNLIYIQDIIDDLIKEDPNFDRESIDVIVEIIDPKHYDVVSSYCVNNVVISNRYVSKMITQIAEKEAIFNFYTDILTYDEDVSNGYVSKEVYCKKVNQLFTEIPGPCTAEELIRAVFREDPTTVVLGYVKPGAKVCLFEGDQSKIPVELEENDKLVVFSAH